MEPPRCSVYPKRPRSVLGSLLVLLALTVACKGPATDPTDPDDPDPDPDPVWSAPIPLGSTDGRIAAGTILHYVSKVAGSAALHHRTSGDAGGTWSDPVPLTTSGSPPLYRTFVADQNRLFLLTTESDGHLYLRRSSNAGADWQGPVQLSSTDVQKPHRVALAVRGDFVHVVNSREFNAGANRQIFYWRSTSGGAAFEAVVVLDDAPDGPVNPSVAADGGTVHVVYEHFDEGPQMYYLRSTDNGATWSDPLRLSDPADGNALRGRVQAVDGRVIVSWQQDILGTPFTQRIGVRRSPDGGASWQAIQFVTPGGRLYNHQVIAATSGGDVHVACIDGTPGSADATAQYVWSDDYGATWSSPQMIASQAEDGVSQPFDMAADAEYIHLVLGPAPSLYSRRPR